jgi:acetyl esterase/lipase
MMMPFARVSVLLFAVAALSALPGLRPASPDPMPLWPGEAPGEKGDVGEEKDLTKPKDGLVGGRSVIRLGNVSKPTLTLYRPPKEKDTGASVVVCPGGGYSILAMDLEGTEVCEWLASIGVTGILLKYRVPARKGSEKHTAALQDAQRSMGLVRFHAKEWNLDPNRVGILGFSAGGHLSAMASTAYETRTYPAVDGADLESCRPDFAVLIYPAWLVVKDDVTKLSSEFKVTPKTSPTFIVMTQDDPIKVECAVGYGLALKNAHVPVELHLYPKGGHGYGLRPSPNDVTRWPERAAEWMKTQGWLGDKH